MAGTAHRALGDTYDPQQTEMMDEQCILVDESDAVIGSASKVECHLGEGLLHRAFSVLLFDSQGRLLLQKRSADKITFPSVWANSCCSHPLHISEELESTDGLGVKRAAIRKLQQELGISPEQIPLSDFHIMTRMLYRARLDAEWVEHELDHILAIIADVDTDPNPNEISEIRWVTQSELNAMQDDDEHIIAPWFEQIANRFLPHWWSNLQDLNGQRNDTIHRVGDVTNANDSSVLLQALGGHRDEVELRMVKALGKTKHERLRSAMLHLIEGGGKRLRAILPWLVADASGTPNHGLYDLGAAIEIIHNFTLVHDDIMDNDEVRRGRPAVHVAYDNPTAINAGDAMLAVSFELLSESDHISDEHFRQLIMIIGNMVRRVSEGQQMDMEFETSGEVEETEYLTMISGKTAAMFKTSAQTGALLSGAEPSVVAIMSEWGEHVGLCFQLMDDLIDVTGDSETLGKPACSDIITGKRTLIAIHALQSDPQLLPTFHSIFGTGDEQIGREVLDLVVKELNQSGSIEYAKQKAMVHHASAHQCLDKLPQNSAMAILRELTDWQLVRIS